MLLIDINVWIALTFDTHIHHPPAKIWFDGLTDEMCYFCRMTQQGFLRLSTNRKMHGINTLTLDEAWEKYDRFMSDSMVSFAAEPLGLEPYWRSFTQGQTFSTHVWNDAYLAAFAVVGGYGIITFDQAFTQFPGLSSTILA